MRFPGSFIFNGLQPLKMAVYPFTAHRLSKNCVFQQPAKQIKKKAGHLLWSAFSFRECYSFLKCHQ